MIAPDVTQMVADLESWNPTHVRITAAHALGRLPAYSRLAADALARTAKDYESTLQEVAKASLGMLYARRQGVLRADGRPRHEPAVEVGAEDAAGPEQCRCNFCGKEVVSTQGTTRYQERLSGPGRFFCTFCLRHGFNHRGSRDTLVLTFRGIIGYYYYAFYALSKQVWMYASEIEDYAAAHAEVGGRNPLFAYDPETYLWFVDFSRVGESKRRLALAEVLKTVGEVLLSFNLYENVADIRVRDVYQKFAEAVVRFHQTRTRPDGARVLAPTLVKTGASEFAAEPLPKYSSTWVAPTDQAVREKRRIHWDETRRFLPQALAEAAGRRFS